MRRVQVNILTHIFRETDVLRAARTLLRDREHLNILSFGCSVGDELATLRAMFPRARVQGCDINTEVLEIANATMGHLAEIFLSSEAEIRAHGPFDLVCAFSSLCVNPLPDPAVMAARFPFSQFEEMIGLLAEVLKPGGLLALKNTSYLFHETSSFEDFDTCRVETVYQIGYVPVLRKDQSVALRSVNTVSWPVQRQENVTGISDWNLVDSLFRKRLTKGPMEIINVPALAVPVSESAFEIARWSRSNLDMQRGGTDRTGLIELRFDFAVIHDPANPEATLLEQTTHRQPLDGGRLQRVAFLRSSTIGGP